MMNDMKKNKLIEAEMENVAGGIDNGRNPDDFLTNDEDCRIWNSLSLDEIHQVLAQPTASSRYIKMHEIYNAKGPRAHGGGASGGW